MIKRTKKQRLRGEADRYWFVRVFKKWDNKCGCCGNIAIQAHHFFPKSLYPALRYDLNNGVPLCMGCHFKHHHRGDPAIHLLITANRGKKWLKELEKHKRDDVLWTDKFYLEIIERLKI